MFTLLDLPKYQTNYRAKDQRNLTDEELECYVSGEVISSSSEYGVKLQVALYTYDGQVSYIDLSQESCLSEGDSIDLVTCKIVTLSRRGSEDKHVIIE